MDWFSFFAGVASVFAVVGLTIFGIALAVAMKKIRASEK